MPKQVDKQTSASDTPQDARSIVSGTETGTPTKSFLQTVGSLFSPGNETKKDLRATIAAKDAALEQVTGEFAQFRLDKDAEFAQLCLDRDAALAKKDAEFDQLRLEKDAVASELAQKEKEALNKEQEFREQMATEKGRNEELQKQFASAQKEKTAKTIETQQLRDQRADADKRVEAANKLVIDHCKQRDEALNTSGKLAAENDSLKDEIFALRLMAVKLRKKLQPANSRTLKLELQTTSQWTAAAFTIEDDQGAKTKWELLLMNTPNGYTQAHLYNRNEKTICAAVELDLFGNPHTLNAGPFPPKQSRFVQLMGASEFTQKTAGLQSIKASVEISIYGSS